MTSTLARWGLIFASLAVVSARQIASLRSRTALLSTVAQRQSRGARISVERAVAAVLAEAKPLRFASRRADADDGVWRLLWSSQTADVNPFAHPSSVLGGECVQRISSRDGLVQNVVRWGSWELVGSARVRVQRLDRLVRRFVTITGVDIVRAGEQFVTLFNLRALIDQQQVGDSGYLDDVYNDGTLRISRANNGFMYIYCRERANADKRSVRHHSALGRGAANEMRLQVNPAADGAADATAVVANQNRSPRSQSLTRAP